MNRPAPELDRHALQRVEDSLNRALLGKPEAVRLALVCLLANGHLLIEDRPGVGKTTLAHALAQVLGLDYHRIQFTSDLLPGDVVGVSVFDQAHSRFDFHPGPIFAQVLLADEVNRAPPKTQSALLEAMQERQVSVDGRTHLLPKPFFVIATQNPAEQIGTHPLPESQLDRFLMSIELGYPEASAERALLEGSATTGPLAPVTAEIGPAELLDWQRTVSAVTARPALLDYLQALLRASRDPAQFRTGLSPRAGLGLLQAARAHALIDGRAFVTPDDLRAVLPPVAIHRIASREAEPGAATVSRLLECVPVD
ncbi:ATPase associated with various cellular activities AAA_3 [Thioalkalivibrio nitratireducens DSM 14787]|uniref:ATPase associated with various cellular activities AAA_3 n=1 Tax=Thioalkalivibrio nitratireducens (strain DSM 14787 / UNIQEM 213 / ALEN2) TaxID=1255043 RepID=L0DTJ2_THIND|nr:MoxR family ATPase [Thioalkalivibrio nitratireducens]AGA32904.1 ATPase associated with various cellular activities AAA_3 [Thioalkalivibrio nitratireducens DSM 14787]